MNLRFKVNCTLLDVVCVDGGFTIFFTKIFKLKSKGIDIYEDYNWKKLDTSGIQFNKDCIFKIPFRSNSFDYIILKNILHHIDEPTNHPEKFKEALFEVKKVCKLGGHIASLGSNKYNPISYLHMVILRGHIHLLYDQLEKIISNSFKNYQTKTFELYVHPKYFLYLFKVYKFVMNNILDSKFRAYGVFEYN